MKKHHFCAIFKAIINICAQRKHDNIAHDLLEDELLKKQDNGLYTITNLGAVLFARRITEFPTVSRKAIRVVQFEGKSKIELLKEYTGQKGYAVGFEGLMEFLKALLPSKEVISGAVRNLILK